MTDSDLEWRSWKLFKGAPFFMGKRTVGHKSRAPCFHEKYMEAGIMTFVAHYTLWRCFKGALL